MSTKSVSDWRSYLPDGERRRLQHAYAPPEHRVWEEDKLRFAQRCMQFDLPTVPIVGVISTTSEHCQIAEALGIPLLSSATALQSLFSSVESLDGFAKPLGGGMGYGAFGFRVRDGVLVPSGQRDSTNAMFAECSAGRFAHRGYILQPRIRPHALLHPLLPGPGLGTIRVFSFRQASGKVIIPFAGLRVPAANAECDNFQFNGLGAAINIETGALTRAVGQTASQPVSHFVERHQETGAPFQGHVIPNWDEVLALVAKAAHAFEMLPALGWDIAVTPTGPVLVETNWQFGTTFAERLTNRGWATELRAMYAELPRHHFPSQ